MFEQLHNSNRLILFYHFQLIKEKSEQETKEKRYTVHESNKANNRRLNRYRDVNPYDHSRIILHRGDVDYVNANLVRMERANRKYILTQGPLPQTVGHFWLMIWEQKCPAILMLNKIIEKRQVKCHQYWPENIGSEYIMAFDDVNLKVEYSKCENFTNFSKRTFRLIDGESNESREVIQFHYTTWPDFYVPSSPIAFLQFLKKVRDSGVLDADAGPTVVHCSAGIGRSGTFCLVDTCLVLVEKNGPDHINIADLLLELRSSRMGLIQTADQLYFSYQAIIEGIKHLNDPVIVLFCLIHFSTFFYSDSFHILQAFFNNEEAPVSYDDAPPLPPPRVDSLVPTTTPSTLAANNDHSNDHPGHHGGRTLPPLPIPVESIPSIDDSTESSDSDDSKSEEAYSNEQGNEITLNGRELNNKQNSLYINGSGNTKYRNENADFNFDAALPPSPKKLTSKMDSDYSDQYKRSSATNDLDELAIQQNDQAMDSNKSQKLAPTQNDSRYAIINM